jgi:hypothetical protein
MKPLRAEDWSRVFPQPARSSAYLAIAEVRLTSASCYSRTSREERIQGRGRARNSNRTIQRPTDMRCNGEGSRQELEHQSIAHR